jgi:hypothetical protein
MVDKNYVYFLMLIVFLLTYSLYKETQENERLFKICADQEEVIQEQNAAIEYQNLYLNYLRNSYNQNSPRPVH